MAKMLATIQAKGKADAQVAGFVRQGAITLAEFALILDSDEKRARENFELAAEFASRMVRTKEVPAPLRTTEITTEYSPDTGQEHWVANQWMETLGNARMSIADYNDALSTLWSFGGDAALGEAARVPEVEYRSPGIVMSEAGFKSFEVDKLLALGEEERALALVNELFSEMNDRLQNRFQAVRACVAADWSNFDKCLMSDLKFHKKEFAKQPGNLEGLICHSGMMLCRLALRHGLRIPDQNYLPLRFAPWYGS